MEDKFPDRLRRLRREKGVAAPLPAGITDRTALEDETWLKSNG